MLSADPDLRWLMALRAVESGLLRLKWLAAATRFELAMRQHDRALKRACKANFNPAQPRVPRGQDGAGEWTAVDANGNPVRPQTDSNARARLASSDTPRLGPKSKLAIAIELAKQAIKLYRDQNLLHDLFGQKDGTVAYGKINDVPFYGDNSDSSAYRDRDLIAAEQLRSQLIAKYPDSMARDNIGQKPNDAVFHAETNALLRAARANGGSLTGKELEIHVDRPMCFSCDRILPLVGIELGDPTVTFIGPSGVPKTMRGGVWIK